MSSVGQIVALKMLNAVKSTNNIGNSNVNNGISFEDVLSNNLIGGSNCHSCCCKCDNNILGVLSLMANEKLNVSDLIKSDSISKTEGVETPNSKMDKAMKMLEEQIGKPYVWGANGPKSFDCSGLTRYIYKEALGIDIPRVSYDQAEFGKAVDKKDLQKGDLVFFDTMKKGRVSHVGIYVGNDEFIHASNPKDGVKKSKLSGYYMSVYKGARRP